MFLVFIIIKHGRKRVIIAHGDETNPQDFSDWSSHSFVISRSSLLSALPQPVS